MPEYGEQSSYVPQMFDPELAINPEDRCPCLLLLDTSASMSGEPIKELNEALIQFKDELMADSMAAKRVEVAVVTFGPVQVVSDFVTPDVFQPLHLTASGDTPMGAAIKEGFALLQRRKQHLRAHRIKLYRPWIFLITDGGPTDPNWRSILPLIADGVAKEHIIFFAIGVKGANMEILSEIAPPGRAPFQLRGLRFGDLFKWLSDSLKAVSGSRPGDRVALPDYSGWSEI